MDLILLTYGIYLLLSLLITIWLGQHLYKSGRYFLVEAIDDETVADAVNRLLLVGFYLTNIAYALLMLAEKKEVFTLQQLIEVLSQKMGLIISVLAIMHFINIAVALLWRWYKQKNYLEGV